MTPEQDQDPMEAPKATIYPGGSQAPATPPILRQQTLGEKRVRAAFNPSQNSLVDSIKTKSAELIDLCNSIKIKAQQDNYPESGEVARCCALAQTNYEDAAMWAVKAATA